MSGTITKLNVLNMALAELQQEPVLDENADTSNAATLRTYFDTALDVALKAHAWDFATKYVELTLDSDADNITPYSYLFQLPEDFLEFQRVYDENGETSEYQNTSEGLYTNSNPAYLKYTYRNTDFGTYDSAFAQALAFSLAELASSSIIGNQGREQYLEGKAGRKEAIAASKSVGRGKTTYNLGSTWANVHQQYS